MRSSSWTFRIPRRAPRFCAFTRRGVGSHSMLAQACEGFSGAEIEQAVVAAIYSANAQHRAPDAEILRAEIAATRPLAVVMAEKVEALREWADGRTVPAS